MALWGHSYLVISLAKLFLDILLRPGRKGCERAAVKALSALFEAACAQRKLNRDEGRAAIRDVLAKG